MITLDDERRAALIAAVEGNDRLPEEAKSRILAQLEQSEVSAAMVAGIPALMLAPDIPEPASISIASVCPW